MVGSANQGLEAGLAAGSGEVPGRSIAKMPGMIGAARPRTAVVEHPGMSAAEPAAGSP